MGMRYTAVHGHIKTTKQKMETGIETEHPSGGWVRREDGALVYARERDASTRVTCC